MRIAYVCGDLGIPIFGTKGAAVHVRELCRALARLGNELLILTPRAGGEAPAGFDIPVHEIPAEADGAPGAQDVRALAYASALRREALAVLAEFRPDVLYERYSLCGTAGTSLAAELRVPLLLEVNAPLSDEHAAHRGLTDAETAQSLERAIVRSADRVVAVSPWLARWLIGLGVPSGRITVLPNGVDPARFEGAAGAGEAVRARFGLDSRPVVGFLGTLRPWHDVATLVRALARLRRDGPAAVLLVVGEGPEWPQLEALARAEGVDVAFAGAVPHEDVPSYLAAVDVAVAPYASADGFYFSPLKLVEYLAAARPVVAADAGELGHCVRPGETGLLYPPGDTEALADAIRELLADPARAATFGRAGREHVREEHTWERNARAVTALARIEVEARRAA